MYRASQGQRDHRSNGQRGFTLVELLVVITILGILAAIVVFSVSKITDRGDTSACKASVAEIQTAEEARKAGTDNAYATIAILESEGWVKNATAQATKYGITVNTTTGLVSSTSC